MARWGWLQNLRQFFSTVTRRIASFFQVRGWSQTSIDKSSARTAELAAMLADGRIDLPSWQTQMREQIKREYIEQYLAGRGGIDQMQAKDWGSIGGSLREQYHKLDDFAREIASGKLSEAQIRARSKMYINSGREAFERAKRRNFEDKEIDEERWRLTPAEHCKSCLGFEAEGWQPLGHFPFPGQGKTLCLTNCRCFKEYRNSRTGEIFGD